MLFWTDGQDRTKVCKDVDLIFEKLIYSTGWDEDVGRWTGIWRKWISEVSIVDLILIRSIFF